MNKRQTVGQQGEAMARAYLVKVGYDIITHNWRCAIGELDIVAQKDNVLIFVEVRTRRGHRFGTPEESITPAKQARLVALAETYWQEMTPEHKAWRIDVVAVRMGAGEPQINHIENAVGW